MTDDQIDAVYAKHWPRTKVTPALRAAARECIETALSMKASSGPASVFDVIMGYARRIQSARPPEEALRDALLRRTRRVVCAAVRAPDGDLVLGIRHYSADMRIQIAQRIDGKKFEHRLDEDQGFVDQYGAFMSRREAYLVAVEAGQHVDAERCGKDLDGGHKLYSEGLY